MLPGPITTQAVMSPGPIRRHQGRFEPVEPGVAWFMIDAHLNRRANPLPRRNAELATAASRKSDRKVRPVGFEPTTLGSEDRCAIQLRHGRRWT